MDNTIMNSKTIFVVSYEPDNPFVIDCIGNAGPLSAFDTMDEAEAEIRRIKSDTSSEFDWLGKFDPDGDLEDTSDRQLRLSYAEVDHYRPKPDTDRFEGILWSLVELEPTDQYFHGGIDLAMAVEGLCSNLAGEPPGNYPRGLDQTLIWDEMKAASNAYSHENYDEAKRLVKIAVAKMRRA
jgi:hypothetical protein